VGSPDSVCMCLCARAGARACVRTCVCVCMCVRMYVCVRTAKNTIKLLNNKDNSHTTTSEQNKTNKQRKREK